MVEHEEERDRFVDSVVDLTAAPAIADLEVGYLQYAKTYDALVLSIHTVQMTGSDNLLRTLGAVQEAHGAVHDGIGLVMELTREGDGQELLDSPIRRTMKAGFKEELRLLPEAMDMFIRIARTDLGLAG